MTVLRTSGRVPSGPIAWCVVSAVLFGASTPASKALLDAVGPVTLSGLLYLGAGLFVAPAVLRRGRERWGGARHSAARLAGAVILGGVVGPVLLLEGLSRATASSVSLWLTLETVFTAILARRFFAEHLTARTWTAVALVTGASAMLSPVSGGDPIAIAWVALACLAWGLDNNLTATIDRLSPAQVTLAKGIVAGVVNVGLGRALEPGTVSPTMVAAALAVGALSYGASLVLYVASAQQLGATRSQLVFSTAPLWGVGLAVVFLGESLSLHHYVAAALMAFALWLWESETHTHRHAHARIIHRHHHRHDDGHHDHHHHDCSDPLGWHIHEHEHEPREHAHPHRPDLHHRHRH